MYPPPLNPTTLDRYKARLNHLRPDAVRKWGALTVTDMMRHLTHTLDLTIGTEQFPSLATFKTRYIIRYLALYLAPRWPRGKVKLPDSFTPTAAGDFEAERTELVAAMGRFVEAAEREPGRKVSHPLFGPFTLRQWQRFHGRHVDHHLSQFGA